MKVRDVMKSDVHTIPSTATYEEAARILYDHRIGGAPVVDAEGRLVGLVSEKDFFRVLYPYERSFYTDPEAYLDLEERETKVNDIRHHAVQTFMAKDVVTITPDAPIMQAGGLMLAKQVHRLPVMDEGKLVGVVTRGMIYRAILKQKLGW
ncbi:MAG TPA: CBS domain-containing protein [Candidatus Methylomirabilis sp.]|nr:CBS domain-containing protein [Candidatus Methylomirabilis sp.]